MKKTLYMAVAAIAVLSSCSSSEDITKNESDGTSTGLSTGAPTEFTATIVKETGSVGSRSTLSSEYYPNWSSTDKVNINGGVFTVTPNASDPTKADLKFSSGALSLATTYKALFAGGDTQADYWDEDTKSFKLPATYTYSAGQFNMPMYAEATGSKELYFYNICGVLAVKVKNSEMTNVTKVIVTSDHAICGACTIAKDANSKYYASTDGVTVSEANQTVTLDCGTAGVDIPTGDDGITFYVPVPVFTSSTPKFQVTVRGTMNETRAKEFEPFVYSQSMVFSGATQRNMLYNFDFAISGASKFSVSASQKVYFTKGNLWSDSSGNLGIEEAQGDYPTAWDADHVGHLYSAVVKSQSYTAGGPGGGTASDIPWYGTEAGLTIEKKNDGGTTIWTADQLRCLSKDQWTYLFATRTNSSNLCKAKVALESASRTNQNCIVIAPDNFVGTLKTSYSEEELKAFGLVCLPAAGYRLRDSEIRGANSSFSYWTTTLSNKEGSGCFTAYWINGINSFASTNYYTNIYAYPVRLVRYSK